MRASGCGADIDLTALRTPDRSPDLEDILEGGEDYELLFAAPPDQRTVMERVSDATATPVRRIGKFREAPGISLQDGAAEREYTPRGWDPFRE